MHADLICTYRLQLSAAFTLRKAASVVPYLAELGVSHVYLSPILQAGCESAHGYDVTDPTRISAELGGDDALVHLFNRLREHQMGAVIDFVPNHLASVPENPWWWEVLRDGPTSAKATCFDIDWTPPDRELAGKVLLPILGDHLGNVLRRNEIQIGRDDHDRPELRYFEHRLPLNEQAVAWVNDGITDPSTLLKIQHYRLVSWRAGADEINYRRFFDVATLAGVRVEIPHVFDATHRRILECVKDGPVDGLRIDHPDGLRDPAGYLRTLRESCPNLWLVVEKILEPGEGLNTEWPVDGTTGYDFLQRVGGIFIDPSGEKPISDFYSDFTSHREPYGSLVRVNKRRVLEQSFDGDLRRLVESLKIICCHPEISLDCSRRVLRDLLTETLASFPIYRTYVHPPRNEVSAADRDAIRHALASTRRREHPFDEELLLLLEDLLCGHGPDPELVEDFVARFQQLSGPIMAKGVEDTTFYSYDRLLALNEVGCDPARFGVSVQSFHESCAVSHREWPLGMLSTSTHDTKRSEDVRARLSLLSEMPDDWAENVRIWSHHNSQAWQGREPDRSAEHLLYQTLVGAWPISPERIEAYMMKACREAKSHTSWTRPDEAYESRIQEFTRRVLADDGFRLMLDSFVTPLIPLGRINSLAQTLLKLTAPGTPDLYQGCDLWDNSLVDPDNRRAVDYELRLSLLDLLSEKPDLQTIMEQMDDGLPKLFVIRNALSIRRRFKSAFAQGEGGIHQPLLISGSKLDHAVAYTRGGKVAVVVPRLVRRLGGHWEDTCVDLGQGEWRNVFDETTHSHRVNLNRLLQSFPVALLHQLD